MSSWVGWVVIAVLAIAVAVLGVALARQRRALRDLTGSVATLTRDAGDLATLTGAVPKATRQAPRPAGGGEDHEVARVEPSTFVVTRLEEFETAAHDSPGQAAELEEQGTPARIDGSLFADLVLRESVVKAVSWAYGLGRAASPEARNRVWFAMRQEVKRSRKQRKVELRAARRYLAQQRRAEDAA